MQGRAGGSFDTVFFPVNPARALACTLDHTEYEENCFEAAIDFVVCVVASGYVCPGHTTEDSFRPHGCAARTPGACMGLRRAG